MCMISSICRNGCRTVCSTWSLDSAQVTTEISPSRHYTPHSESQQHESGVWRPASCFLVGAKTTGQFVCNFNMTFLATWGYASEFLKMLPKFKMAARGHFQKNLWAQKLLKLKVRNYSNFTITFPTIWRCAGDFLKV